MWIILDANSNIPLKKQLYMKIKEYILNGTVVSMQKLPSTRALAKELSVSRNTVLEVYDQLIAEGYLEGRHGSGTVVAAGINKLQRNIGESRPPAALKAVSEEKEVIDFRSGIPELEHFPRKEWARLYHGILSEIPSSSLRYRNPGGVYELREAISGYLFRTRGIVCSPDNIMIVAGSTQGLSLISRLLYGTGSFAAVEDPGHYGLRNVISSAGYAITAVPADDKGMRTDLLKPSANTAFVYTTPSHQYPLGGILPIQRRLSLVRYAADNNCYLIEDDYDSEFRYEGEPVNSLYELCPDRVIYLGSFSKILAPAVRLGFILLPVRLRSDYGRLKMYTDIHTEVLSQYVLAEFIHNGGLEKYIWKMKKLYNRKRIHLLEEMNGRFPGEFEVRGQAAGLHLLMHFHNCRFTPELLSQIQAGGVRVYPVEKFALQHLGRHCNDIILGYGHLSFPDITKGVEILGKILHGS